ncbi:MAG TPA: hypothetical protein VMC83_12515 [Streptosporangiaceae bacterium]|nr:hypothetical protein [Streptosporangiaceae bacterium]
MPEQPCREPGATSLRQAASAVADGVGSLCRLTLGPQDRLRGPADVSDVVAGVWVAVSLLPQLFGQLAAFLEVEYVRGAVAGGPAAGERVRAISDALHRAGLDAEAMAAALASAGGEITHLQAGA